MRLQPNFFINVIIFIFKWGRMVKKIAVVLSGCGVFDGSEIHETVLTLLALSKAGVAYQCLAPNIIQTKVVNHLTSEEVEGGQRNVLEESARIARGQILDIAKANPADYAAVIFPGGYGAALNLCDFAIKGETSTVQPNVVTFTRAIATSGKPAGFICIAPALITKIYGTGIRLTIGSDEQTAHALQKMGAIHVTCTANDIVVDDKHKIVTTPAYMLTQSISEAASGIEKLVHKVLELI